MRKAKFVVFCVLAVLLAACYVSPADYYHFGSKQDVLGGSVYVEKLPVVVGKPLEAVGVVVNERKAVEQGIDELEKMLTKVPPNTPQHEFYDSELQRLRSRLVRIIRRE